MIPEVDPELGERSRDVAERRQAGDLQCRHEPAPGLDRRQLQPGKNTKTCQRQERQGQQHHQAFGYRHKGAVVGTNRHRACLGGATLVVAGIAADTTIAIAALSASMG